MAVDKLTKTIAALGSALAIAGLLTVAAVAVKMMWLVWKWVLS